MANGKRLSPYEVMDEALTVEGVNENNEAFLNYEDITDEYGVQPNPALEDSLNDEALGTAQKHEDNMKALFAEQGQSGYKGDVAPERLEHATWSESRINSIYKSIKNDILGGAIDATGIGAMKNGLEKMIEQYPQNPANAYVMPILDLFNSSEQKAMSITDEIVDGFLDRGEKLFEDVQSTRGLGKKYLQERYPELHEYLYEDIADAVKTASGVIAKSAIHYPPNTTESLNALQKMAIKKANENNGVGTKAMTTSPFDLLKEAENMENFFDLQEHSEKIDETYEEARKKATGFERPKKISRFKK